MYTEFSPIYACFSHSFILTRTLITFCAWAWSAKLAGYRSEGGCCVKLIVRLKPIENCTGG